MVRHRLKNLGWIFLMALGSVLASWPLQAKLLWVKKAQAQGCKEIKDCRSCHQKEKPKDGKDLNDLGKWLVQQKQQRKVKEVDVAWLKERRA